MDTTRTDEFRKDAVVIALNNGLSQRQVADDLGVGLSILNKWVNAQRDMDVVSAEDLVLVWETERLRHGLRILKEKKDIQKKLSACRHSKSPRSSCRGSSAYAAP